ncbi:hypothetical protein [Brevibacillus sp. DP1.3A]|uniref:hypothetical protein n=1 Tax=Brevibacillus sp. DP1.3A TaxID=2738867 RepID=UPI00156BABF0|nr:hypothetical protein [Brevibacillus sp. DP1.3A]UED73240.1 hypothetical protein HP399_021205 [Brevibacillus sp. DP1.3A]
MKGRKILKLSTCIVLLMTLVAGNYGVEAKEVEITTSKIKQGPYKIGVIGDEEKSAVGKTIEEAISEQRGFATEEESIQILEEDIQEIPDDIDALWISEANIKNKEVKKLYKQAKKENKPFYIFGEKLDAEDITNTFEPNLDITPEYLKESTYSLDMFGYKFENNQVKLSAVISINRGNQDYKLEDLENMTKRYNIEINKSTKARKSQFSFLSPNIAAAAGIDVNLPDSFSNIYTWETEINNFIDINSTQQRLAKSYHVWEVYKDETPDNPDTKSYVYFRADQPLSEIEIFKSREFVDRLDADKSSNIITKGWLPDNSSISGNVTYDLTWPPGASVSWDTSGDIEIYDSTGSLSGDWHKFKVEDNEYLDDVLTESDVWVSSQSYTISQDAKGHKIGHDFEATIDGHSGRAEPNEVDNWDTSGNLYFYWVVRR